MQKNSLWSLRLGFTNNQANLIAKNGIKNYLQTAMHNPINTTLPDFLKDVPKTIPEFKAFKKRINQAASPEEKKKLKRKIINPKLLKIWWIDNIKADQNPLREKMVVFWHNHFVAASNKVKVNYWIYQQHQILQQHAFGNFKTLTKAIVKSNAIVKYLDNTNNRKGKLNENLSRELLELFTLGIGNYTEQDIKEGAKALSGLGLGNETAKYRKKLHDTSEITYLGETGNYDVDNLIDIIFKQKNIPYRITKKILQWFITDNPSDDLVQYYGDYFRSVDFEIAPLLTKICTEEYEKNNQGTQIKNPLQYTMQLLSELQLQEIDSKAIVAFLRSQGMDVFNPPNVKGWDGGKSWLTSQTYLQRHQIADLLCSGKSFTKKKNRMQKQAELTPKITLSEKAKNADTVIEELANRLLFQYNNQMKEDFIQILKYDFDPKSEHAQHALLRLVNHMVKTPQFQLI